MKSTHMAAAWAKYLTKIPKGQAELAATLKVSVYIGAYEMLVAVKSGDQANANAVCEEVIAYCRGFAAEAVVIQ